jgi:voltage-gated potassium channel
MTADGTGRQRHGTPARWTGLFGRFARRGRLARLAARRKAGQAAGHAEADRGHVAPSFWRRRSVRRVMHGILAEMIVVLYGVLGYVVLGWTPFDALYMVVITISGVGFGEVRAMGSTAERIHTMIVITFGMVVVGYTLGRFIQFLTEGEIEDLVGHRRMRRQIEKLEGHTVVAGFGRVGALVCDGLVAAEIPFVVIENDKALVPDIESHAFLYIAGDATEEKVLLDAGLGRAKVLVTAMPNDAANVYITLTARQLAPRLMIVARAEMPSTPKKLRQAGANHVILPALIGARRIVSLLTNPTAVEFAELVTQQSSLAIEMDDVPIRETSKLEGRTLRDADVGRRTGIIVIAVKRADGRVEFPPPGDEPLRQGDSIVVIGRRSNLDQFRTLFET